MEGLGQSIMVNGQLNMACFESCKVGGSNPANPLVARHTQQDCRVFARTSKPRGQILACNFSATASATSDVTNHDKGTFSTLVCTL